MAITRRRFIGFLAALPVVGKMFATPPPKRQIYSFSFGKNSCGDEIPGNYGNHLFKMIQDTKGDSPYYMPDAEIYPELEDEISVHGSYAIGDTFLMPKIYWQDSISRKV